nr:hypothetical protein [Halostella litorea]
MEQPDRPGVDEMRLELVEEVDVAVALAGRLQRVQRVEDDVGLPVDLLDDPAGVVDGRVDAGVLDRVVVRPEHPLQVVPDGRLGPQRRDVGRRALLHELV